MIVYLHWFVSNLVSVFIGLVALGCKVTKYKKTCVVLQYTVSTAKVY